MAFGSPVDHYENFPVASLLCPRSWRPAVVAIYRFARTADDLADEGDRPADERLARLQTLRDALRAIWRDQPLSPGIEAGWTPFLRALAQARHDHDLPLRPLEDLLDAFEQDVRWTAEGRRYRDERELLDYCRRSANPVGRLLLHLAGVQDAPALQESDAICTALQLINFWQDLGQDLRRGRVYVTDEALRRHGLPLDADLRSLPEAALAPLVLDGCRHARALLRRGWALPRRVGGRFGWELRLVLQGGWRILERIEQHGGHALSHRPRLRRRDGPLLLARAIVHRLPGTDRDLPVVTGAAG